MKFECEELYEILKKPIREKRKIEFKRSDILDDYECRQKLGYVFVSMANSFGGKLFIGINV